MNNLRYLPSANPLSDIDIECLHDWNEHLTRVIVNAQEKRREVSAQINAYYSHKPERELR